MGYSGVRVLGVGGTKKGSACESTKRPSDRGALSGSEGGRGGAQTRRTRAREPSTAPREREETATAREGRRACHPWRLTRQRRAAS